MSELEVSDSLVVSLEVFIDGCSIEEEIWVGLFEIFFALSIGFQSTLKFYCAFIVNKKVGQMSISENVPTFRIFEIKADCLGRHLYASLVVLFSLFRIKFVSIGGCLQLSVDH